MRDTLIPVRCKRLLGGVSQEPRRLLFIETQSSDASGVQQEPCYPAPAVASEPDAPRSRRGKGIGKLPKHWSLAVDVFPTYSQLIALQDYVVGRVYFAAVVDAGELCELCRCVTCRRD